MIPGLNTNIDRDNRRWHIQTELTPGDPPVFITQVFFEGAVTETTRVFGPQGATLSDLLRAQRQAHGAVVEAVRSAEKSG